MEHNIIISDVCENAHINTILCKKDDFMRMKDFINNETLENGYGIIISNPIFMWKYNNGEVFYKYIISNLVKTYTDGGILLEPLAEWEDYLEQITLYNLGIQDLPYCHSILEKNIHIIFLLINLF